MNQIQLDLINNDIYEDGKIYWNAGYDFTSNLWERLKKEGWSMRRTKGFVQIFDKEGHKVVIEFGIVQALKELANVLR